MKKFLFVAGLFTLLIGPAYSAGEILFNKQQMDIVSCASEKMRLFYFYLTPNRNKNTLETELECRGRKRIYKMPPWFEEGAVAMSQNVKWRDPIDGDLTEADLWQSVLSGAYEFFDLARKSFPADKGGVGMPPEFLTKEYSMAMLRFEVSASRLYRAKLYDSLEGRGRIVMPGVRLLLDEMESVMEAITNNDGKRFALAVVSAAGIADNMFSQLSQPPRDITQKEKEIPPFYAILPVLILTASMVGLFFLAFVYFSKQEAGFNAEMQKIMVKIKQWTLDFNRQFINVKVQYIVLAPIILFAIFGLLSGSAVMFFIMFAAGIYLGLKLPASVLTFLKRKRGEKIDKQLMDGLVLLSNSLKSGMDIVQGFELVSQDLLPPISEEFGLVIKNYQLGTPFERALYGLEERVESRMLSYMIKAIILQRRVGGNLTKIFERLVSNIREESKLQDKVKALTSQQKIQSVVVAIMPWIMLALMFVFQGEAMLSFYSSFIGIIIFFACIVWMSIGMFLVKQMGKVEV